MKVVFWGKYIDTYLSDTLGRYEALVGEPVRYILVEERFTRRAENTVDQNDPPTLNTILLEDSFFNQAHQILNENQDAVHIFLSFWGDKRLFRVLLKALWRRQQVAVVFEPYAAVPCGYWRDEGWLLSRLKVLGRKIAYRALWPLMHIFSRGKRPCILAVSPLAEEQLRRVGFKDEIIYPFGYFVERVEVEPVKKNQEEDLRVMFSGSLIKRKGLDIAISAVKLANTPSGRVQLDIYGPGEIEKYLPHEIPGIRYLGVYPQREAQGIIHSYDLLLVPSRHEGWGLVVNEALLQGVPVLASDRVGAGCLLENSGAGKIFRSGDPSQLSALLSDLTADRAKLHEMTDACVNLRDRITPSMGADYLKKVLDHHFNEVDTLPKAVWLD